MTPNLILFNATIYDHPTASAIAIQNGKILAIGDTVSIKDLANSGTRSIDLDKHLVLPGLSDAHFHFFGWCLGWNDLKLKQATDLAAVQKILKGRTQTLEPGRWIAGHGWNESEWPRPDMPTRYDLDKVSQHHPVILWRSDAHVAVVNSLALKMANITANTPHPLNGIIDHDDQGEPTGILKEFAIELVANHLSNPPEVELEATMREAIATLHRQGLTGLHDQRMMSGAEGAAALSTYQRLHRQAQLNLRLCTNIHHSHLQQAIDLGLESGFGDDYLRLGFVKMFSDGSLGARTAWMLQPYLTGGVGAPNMDMGDIAAVTRLATAHNWAVSIHAIGDRANREILDIFEEVATLSAKPPLPHRIEHVQLLHPDDVLRLAQLNLTASVQPIHLVDDMVLIDKIWGERGAHAYSFRRLWDVGTRLAFGSDCPIADPNPWLGIHAAVNRCKPDGTPQGGWYPAERLSVSEAVWAYSMGNALAIDQQKNIGSIALGKLADLVVVNQNIFEVDHLAIADTNVLMTVFDGQVVYEA